MNFFNRFLLWCALLASPLYRRLGVNLPQLRAILRTKLIMDDRRPVSFGGRRQNDHPKEIKGAALLTLLFTAIFGLFFMFFLMMDGDWVTVLTVYLSLLLVMLASSMVADFSSVLLDVRDNMIILPKPVSDTTFTVARIVHIGIHLFKLALPMGLPGAIYIASTRGLWPGIVMLLLLVLVALFAIFTVNAVYLLMVRLVSPARFKRIIGSLQVIITVITFGSYQLLARSFDFAHLGGFSLRDHPWARFIPTYWLSQSFQLLTGNSEGTATIAWGLTGLLAPIILMVLVVRVLSPRFMAAISRLQGSESPAIQKRTIARTQRRRRSYSEFLSGIFAKSIAQKAAFMFTWRMMMRSRDFKVKVYPSAGYILVYFFIMFYKQHPDDGSTDLFDASHERLFTVTLVYLSGFMLTLANRQLNYSERYKAASIFYSSPVKRPGDVILGSFKAALAMFFLPLFIICTGISLWMIGVKSLPHTALGLSNVLMLNLLTLLIGHRMFPFSVQEAMASKSGSFVRSMVNIFGFTLLGVAHYLLYSFTWVIFILLLLSIVLNWVLTQSIRNTSLQQIRMAYDSN